MTFLDPQPSSSSPPDAVNALKRAFSLGALKGSMLENKRQAAWRAEWDRSAQSEFKRAGDAGLPLSKLRLWHLPQPGTLRNAGRMGCYFAGLIALPSLGFALSPVLIAKKSLPWFSRLVARWDLMGPRSSFGVSVRFDSDNPRMALMRVGPRSEDNDQIVSYMMTGGLTKSQAKEAIIAHELGHAAYRRAMLEEGQRSVVGQSVEGAGVGKSLVEASSRGLVDQGVLARHAVQGSPIFAWGAGLATSLPLAGFAGFIAASYCVEKWLQKRKPEPKLLSAQILEEGFCDAFSILLPMAGPSPDRDLALARARGFEELRAGTPFGNPHGVMTASAFIRGKLEDGFGEDGLIFAQIVRWAAAAGAVSVGVSWVASQFDELSSVVANREALQAQASEHELPSAPSTIARLQRMRQTALSMKEEALPSDSSDESKPKTPGP